MNVTLCSAFRNATPYLERYLRQVSGLGERLWNQGNRLSIVLCEGDSSDNTYQLLGDAISRQVDDYFPVDVDLFQHSHGGPDHGSVVNAERFANLARVWNAIWARIPQDADAVIFVESDLAWEPATIIALLDDLAHVPAVAPMVMLKREEWPDNCFYDFWAFRKNGRNFCMLPPYSEWLGNDMMQLDSAGSCIVMRSDLARQLTWPPEDVCVGLCRQIYELGGSVWLDPKASVIHE